jgi:hypothetical protein
MPSLTDALSSISHHSSQIQHLSSLNSLPAGPFVQAYLYQHTVNGLIRDAHESEARLFKFIGEVESGAGGGLEKRVEKREGVVTPLKEIRRRKDGGGNEEGTGGRDEVDVMLRTAFKLVDD